MRGFLVLLALVLVVGAGDADARKKPKPPPRAFIALGEVSADAALGKRGGKLVTLATAALPDIVAAHPRAVGGEPDAAAKAVKQQKLAGAYTIHVVVVACTETRADDQLTIAIEVDLAGSALPGDSLVFSARAAATVTVDARDGVTPRLRDATIRAAFVAAARDALAKGVDEVHPAPKPKKSKRKR